MKVHPLEESRVKVLQIFVHRLTLDLLENVEIKIFFVILATFNLQQLTFNF